MSAQIIPLQPVDSATEYKACLLSLSTGIAVADARTWRIVFENARFGRWFPAQMDAPDSTHIASRLNGLDIQRARRHLASGKSYVMECWPHAGLQGATLSVELRSERIRGQDFVLIECQDISKQKEAEQQLDGHTRMAKKHTRALIRERD